MDPNEDSDLNSDLNSGSKYDLPLKITFVILLLIVISGLGYTYLNSTKKVTPTPTTKSTKPPPTPSTVRKQEFQGKIIELNPIIVIPIPGFNNIGFSFKLEINEGGIKKSQTILFDKSEISTLKVKNSTDKIISYKDLKIGQIIIVNFKKAEITIID